ncbi:MAG: transporter substrate-binding protein [Rubritepida sp.]|nr:transporter substrate-binding protein [Rubritepida sp.]
MHRRLFLGGSTAATATLVAPRLSLAQRARPLKFVPHADLVVLDPLASMAIVTRNHALMVFDTLYGLDSSYLPHPHMLEGATTESDGRVWKLKLREGLRFHDGEPVLAKDAVASLIRWARLDNFAQTLFSAVDELAPEDDRTFTFRLKRPFPRLPNALCKLTVVAPVVMPERLAQTEPGRMPEIIGSGPFRFKRDEFVSGSRAVYERFEGYKPRESGTTSLCAGPKVVKLDRVEWHIIADPGASSSALLAGEMDWIDNAVPDLLPRFRRAPNITVRAADPSGSMNGLQINHLHPPFDNPAIRRALLGAVDQSDYMTAVTGTDGSLWRAGVGVFCPGTPLANDAGMQVLNAPRDYDKVKRELLAAGYRGEKVTLLQPADLPPISALAEVAADMLRKVGMTVDLQSSDWATLLQRRLKKDPPERGGWNLSPTAAPGLQTVDPAVHFWMRGNGLNAPVGWATSEKLEELRSRWFDTTDMEAQRQLGREMQEQVWRDVPYLPLGQYFQQTAYRNNVVRGVKELPVFWDVELR